MLSSVAPTRSSTFYAHLITKIGKGNLKLNSANKTRFLFQSQYINLVESLSSRFLQSYIALSFTFPV